MDLYFECNNGISGDMSVAALLDLGADYKKLENTLSSLNLDDEFSYKVIKKSVNAIMATDFDVILKKKETNHSHEHTHVHRNIDDVTKIINSADMSEYAKNLAIKIFTIIAEAESRVHGKNIEDVHFHEVGAIDSIVDIISFSLLLDDLNPEKIYFSTLSEGCGSVMCQHGELSVPVPAVCEIASKYKIPMTITDNKGEMITPTGIAIVAALYNKEVLPSNFVIHKTGYGAGKRPYKNPVLRVLSISEN